MSANLVAVTACPTGIAHSQMGAEGLERAAEGAGHDIRIEIQGALGVEEALTDADLAWADAAIVAADVRVDVERFHAANLPVVECPVSEAVTDPEAVVSRAPNATSTGDSGTSAPSTATDGRGENDNSRSSSFLDTLRELL